MRGSFACLLAAVVGAPREPEAKKQGLPPMQLFDLDSDPGETKNLVDAEPEQVKALLRLLDQQVNNGRCTPGQAVSNDRNVTFLPAGVEIPAP